MADAENKTLIADKKPAENAPKASSGGSKKFLLFGIIGIAAIVVGVVLALFVVRPMMSKTPDSHDTSPKQVDSHDTKEDTQGGEHGSTGSAIYTMKDIVVNPASTGGTRFLSVSFAFELKSAAMVAECESKELAIRDALITILSAKTVAQLTDPKEKEIVRYQIRKRISDILKTDQLAQVYYTDFVLQ